MNKLVGVVVVVLVLAAGCVGAAYWSGQRAERWYQEALTEGSKNPSIKLSTVRYERGLFSSQAVTRVQLAMPEGGDSEYARSAFSIRQDIYHGPLPLAGRDVPGVPLAWTGAVVRATLDLDSNAWTRELAKLYGGQEPMVAISQIAFDGASNTRITMPPLTLNNVEELQNFKFAGLQGQFQIAPHGAAVQGDMTVSSLEAAGKPTCRQRGATRHRQRPAQPARSGRDGEPAQGRFRSDARRVQLQNRRIARPGPDHRRAAGLHQPGHGRNRCVESAKPATGSGRRPVQGRQNHGGPLEWHRQRTAGVS